ncbi:MAG: hypothetical protein HYR91_12265 [Flavobacteriia bacterium]|nr:hypothetical protein [Flavobacteriia bacterium]
MKLHLFNTITLLILVTNIYSQENTNTSIIPLTITPIYQYEPLNINTPDYQKELSAITKDNADSLVSIFQKRIDSISIESLFIFSVRLYDLGKKDESVYWFHVAKIRAGIFIKSLDNEKIGGIGSKPFELKQAFIAFGQLAGEYINGYAGGNIDTWIVTLKRVKTSVDSLIMFPQYNSSEIPFLTADDIQKAKNDRLADYDKLISYLEENKKEIKKTRKKNGIEGKY